MKVTKVARTSPRDAGVGSPNAPASGKINDTAKDKKRTLPAGQRGPKVLQSHQARQRCLEFSRG
jgi:hypothetical protein